MKSLIALEQILLWEGAFTSQRLVDLLNVSRQTVSKLIAEYSAQYPDNISYNKSLKQFQIGEAFKSALSSGRFAEYVDVCYSDSAEIYHLAPAYVEPKPLIIRALMRAIRLKQRLDIRYISMSTPDFEERIISPHSLVFDGRRYHVRAWCEKNADFRDFVLSRIQEIYAVEGQALKTIADDNLWHTDVSFNIEPEPRLSEQQKKVIAVDFEMSMQVDGRFQRQFCVKAAMLIYWLQQLRIDIKREYAEAQQVILSTESYDEIGRYLPWMLKK